MSDPTSGGRLAQVEAQLRESEARLTFVLDTSRIGNWELNIDTGEATTSLRHDECFGATEPFDTWSYDIFMTYVHPDDRNHVEQTFRKAVTNGTDWHFECRVVWRDGSVHWIEAHGSHYEALDGQTRLMLGTVADITRYKRLVEESETRYSTLFNATDEGFVVAEMIFDGDRCVDYRFLEANAHIEAQTGLKNIVGKTANEVMPELEDFWFKIFGDVALSGEPIRAENKAESVGGGLFDAYAFKLGGGESRRVGIIFRDVSDQDDSILSLKKLNDTLSVHVEQRTREVRDLAAELALSEQTERQNLAKRLHDSVQQELYAVQFAVASMRKQLNLTKEDTKAVDDLIVKTVRTTREVTRDLKPEILDDTDLCKALKWLVSMMKERHGLTVTLETIDACEIKNAALRGLIFNLSRELLFNVVKHADVAEASLYLNRDDELLTLIVEDKGSGFDTERLSTGSGLGLNGAQKRLSLFGGKLSIDSTAGSGTRITVTIPNESLTLS